MNFEKSGSFFPVLFLTAKKILVALDSAVELIFKKCSSKSVNLSRKQSSSLKDKDR